MTGSGDWDNWFVYDPEWEDARAKERRVWNEEMDELLERVRENAKATA